MSKISNKAEKTINRIESFDWRKAETIVLVALVFTIAGFFGGMKFQDKYHKAIQAERDSVMQNIKVETVAPEASKQ